MAVDEPPRPEGAARVPLVVGAGASAGGVEALTAFVRALPAQLDAAVLVVLHVSPTATSVLDRILDRAGPLRAVAAMDGMELRRGVIYVAPPDRHMVVEDEVVRVLRGPRENGHRPAVDPLLRSIAPYGARAVAVILSGTRDDGTAGAAAIKSAGGHVYAQSLDEAAYGGMIQSALTSVEVDAVLPVARIARQLAELSHPQGVMTDEPANGGEQKPEPLERGASTRYTCPECGGHLLRDAETGVLRYVCMVGHAYAPASLDAEQALAVEGALWTAIRLLGDRSGLMGEMAERAERSGHARLADGYRERSTEAWEAGLAIRRLLEEGKVPTAAPEAPDERG